MHLPRVVHGLDPRRELAQGGAELGLFVRPLARFDVERRRAVELPAADRARVLRHARDGAPVLGPDVGEEVLPLDELHREKPGPLVLAELPQADEVRVLDAVERAELVLEAEERVGLHRPESLQCDALVPLAVDGLVDDAHSPRAQLAEDLEPRRTGERAHDAG